MTKAKRTTVDNPITSSKEDVLDRSKVAHDFAKNIRILDASEGIVVGILGSWGSGKSSFINLMREQFNQRPKLTVVDFNPWMFSGSQQLVDTFFREISAELRIKDANKFGKIAEGLDNYGDALSPIAMIPLVGAWFDRSLKAFRAGHKWWKDNKKSSTSLRVKVSDALLKLDHPIIVVIDDIDRLSTDEIRDIFKLVRLTASFPNLIYILAFDRERVELALNETNIPGRAYLEKIVQVAFDLPAIPSDVLRSQIIDEFNRVLDGVPDLRFSEDRWPDIFVELIAPLVTSLRDVTRLAISAKPTLDVLGSDIDAVDLLALEAIRTFKPDLFTQLQKSKNLLTDVSESYRDDTSEQQAEISKLKEIAGDKEYVDNLVRRIFPAAQRYTSNTHYGSDYVTDWRRNHRVAHIDFLGLYLERTAPSGLLAFRRSERAYELMTDVGVLGDYLDSLKPFDLEDTIAGLEAFEHAFTPDRLVPGATALLNRIHTIPEKEKTGIFDLSRPDITVGRVVLRMLRTLKEESEREDVSKEILAGLESYSSKFDFIRSLGYGEGIGHKLISVGLATTMEKDLLSEIDSGHSPVPDKEWDMTRVYWFAADSRGDQYTPLVFTDVAEIRSLIKTARSVSRSQSFDSRAVKYEESLWWDGLVKIFGSEDAISDSLQMLKDVDGDTGLVGLTEKYLGGWRPKRD